ncbi:ubiquitin-conjugating enzyme E2, J2 [Conidiobolus coronatus NRRL 28638]|uniref:Ubiquitin-conjugating enzyme E2 6 n=1 Tax=Conidiobolus coronatus (strain ATCC 28846 / CBS 209.66 / NRRL 28638) TaxID=796925 RepID=A0A137P2C2_CONC2|nr:ubiquitin-conjugating enzyme E2, J2 [Conidiobolus coronatus NRRL 28638]|eukprot:KXN69061.1 ubiquitin-conjugating enzyme E2, J2 [Conidiobolus coronatus NRRL 28638]
MASKGATKRLTKEYKNLVESPIPYIVAKPLESNILEWHYILTGPPESPYFGGQYHGKVIFPSEYPYKPPGIIMTTPNGRFATDRRLCLSYSDFHPDLWNPSWSVATILNGLLSFMLETQPTSGSIETTIKEKKLLASKSHLFNLNNRHFICNQLQITTI